MKADISSREFGVRPVSLAELLLHCGDLSSCCVKLFPLFDDGLVSFTSDLFFFGFEVGILLLELREARVDDRVRPRWSSVR